MIATLSGAPPALAMQYRLVTVSGDNSVLVATGPVELGDSARLSTLLGSSRRSRGIVAIAFNSPGGAIAEVPDLLTLIKERHWDTIVPANSICASACFILFAGGEMKYAGANALIGVHGASDKLGGDTVEARAVTTTMARLAGALGVPPVIIGKMVQTGPADVAWLTPSDLFALGVVPLDGAAPMGRPKVPGGQPMPMDMARYCRENFGPKARAKALNRHDASSWRCQTRVGLVGIDLRRLCQQQYGVSYGFQLGDRFNAASWSCVSRR